MRNGEANVRREIDIMQRLDHVHVAKFIELIEIEEKQKMYIVLELIGGGSLRTLLESMPEGRLPESHCRWYFRQLIDGLKYIHSQNVVHRDIKVGFGCNHHPNLGMAGINEFVSQTRPSYFAAF